ncbi:MAG: polyprenyl synthetase family protein, partial [Candidatus Bathyarchaeota archaeon]|nr:polyprenyl synthetase family protein [Candidatus Bathyarchaeota archaeon]
GMDITEGKLSLMVIHALCKADRSDREELMRILGMHTSEESLRKKAINIIKKYGAIEYARNSAAKMVRESWSEVDKILPPSEAKKKLGMLADYLIKRKI